MGAVRRLQRREVERVSWILDRLSGLVTAKPAATLVVLLVATIGLGSGVTRLAPQADTTVFLPEDSEVAAASDTIDALFGGIEETVTVRLIFRGDTLTPAGLAQIDATVGQAVGHPEVEPLLTQQRPVLSPTQLIAGPLGTSDFASATQQAIDEAAAQIPVDRLVGTDTDGSGVALANIRLIADVDRDGDTDDDEAALERAELAIGDLAAASQGPLAATTLSPAVIAGESSAATGSEMLVLIGLALLVIAALLLAFTRSLLDLLLSLLGLVLTVVWVMGGPGLARSRGLGADGRAEHDHHHGAHHVDRPGGGLRDPDGGAVSRAAGCRPRRLHIGASRAEGGDDPAVAGRGYHGSSRSSATSPPRYRPTATSASPQAWAWPPA